MSKLLRAQSASPAAAGFLCGFMILTELFTNISKQRLQSPIVLFIPEVLRGWLEAEPCRAGHCTNKAMETAAASPGLLHHCFAEMQF